MPQRENTPILKTENTPRIKFLAKKYPNIRDKKWRLNNLYKITDKNKRVVPFKMNAIQKLLWNEYWYRTIIPKARQHGMSTFICLFMLDEALFNDNVTVGTIADTLTHSQEIFRTKIQFPFNHLPDDIRDTLDVERSNKGEYKFSNNSSIFAITSARGGTINILHLSELGPLAAKQPEKAGEAMTGSVEAVPPDGIVLIESTSGGPNNKFHELCKDALEEAEIRRHHGTQITKMDYKVVFLPWFMNPEYVLTKADTRNTIISRNNERYFASLEVEHNIVLSENQQAFYAKKFQAMKQEKIFLEYPSTIEECFMISKEGAYFKHGLNQLIEDGYIGHYEHNPHYLVDTSWDLGRSDSTVILFTQTIDGLFYVIDYYENDSVGMSHYYEVIKQYEHTKQYRYGAHFAPHDINVHELSTGQSRMQHALQNNVRFVATKRPREKMESIEAARRILERCRIDNSTKIMKTFFHHLQNYGKAWEARTGTWSDRPKKAKCNHAADAFQIFALNSGLTMRNKQDNMPNVAQNQPKIITINRRPII